MTRIYVIYAPEDYLFYDRLTAQARNAKVSAEFDRAQLKQPWVAGWKGNCRNRIYQSNGAIVLISKHINQGGIEWELECAQTFDLPMLGVYLDAAKSGTVPKELKTGKVIEWNWVEIARFIQSLKTGSSAFA